ncbi:MAG: TonB family protein [Bacteroidales bacterium]|nr:TonB family protein [Bacteroidaceae bacterium]MDO4201187.1 TonB family protein [Bacteroidales bacterium]
MAKNRWLLMAVAMMLTMHMSAQFPGGFGNFGQMAKRQAQQKAAEAEKNYQKGNEFLEAQKYDKAFAAYEKAAENGHAGAQYNIGTFYVEGKVVPQDISKAVEWFEKAANQGLKDAQFNLASIYHQGAGVPKDEQKAEYWAKVYKDIIKLEVKKEEQPQFPFPPRQMEPVVEAPDVQAEFEGGQQALMTWLSQNMQYPEEAQKDNAQGRVIVSFIVNKDGSIDEVKVMKSIHPALDEEAARVVKSMPKWTPGKKDGKPVRVRYSLPISFRMAVPETEKSDAAAEKQE